MNLYSFLIKPILFRLDPELAHSITLKTLRFIHSLGLLKNKKRNASVVSKTIMGLHFDNPIGLAAGLDKNGDYIEALSALGFGFIEIGTVTPKPQTGNAKPRLFRLIEQSALINRMGFNNKGLEYVVTRLQQTQFKGVLGVNIGKNHDTPIERAHEDYLLCFHHVAPYASYVTLNISSPNTMGLRDLQQGDLLTLLLKKLKHAQKKFAELHGRYVPLVVKIAPDLTSDELKKIAEILLEQNIDGVIATNTTLSREGVKDAPFAEEMGGVSGKPLAKRSTEVIQQLFSVLQNKIPIIGCGGIFSKQDAEEKMAAGAELVQVYTGLIYAGPAWITQIAFAAL